jgi:hypothetical protein
MKGGQIGMRHRLGFHLQDTPDKEVQRFKLANMVANPTESRIPPTTMYLGGPGGVERRLIC